MKDEKERYGKMVEEVEKVGNDKSLILTEKHSKIKQIRENYYG